MTSYRVVDRDGLRDHLGEGLLWSSCDDAVYWTDIKGHALNRLALATGQVDRWAMPEELGWVVERRHAPGFIAGFRSGYGALTLDPLTIGPLHDPEPALPGNRLNDATVDVLGRIWAGAMVTTADAPVAALYRLDGAAEVVPVDAGHIVANGPAFSPDSRWMYHADTPRCMVHRYAIDKAGDAQGRTDHIAFADDWGMPDGMTVDAEGGLWIACWNGSCIRRFSPDGSLDRAIALPTARITNLCFAGSALDRLFVTSAMAPDDDGVGGTLFEMSVAERGLAPHRCAW